MDTIKISERDVQEALGQFYSRTLFEQAEHATPLDALIAKEKGEGDDEHAVREETLNRLLQYLASEGLHPLTVARRVFALGAAMMVPPFCLMTVRERGQLFGVSHGKEHWQQQRQCTDVLRRQGARGLKGSGAKGSAASGAAAVAQQGNKNRTGGKKQRPISNTKNKQSSHVPTK